MSAQLENNGNILLAICIWMFQTMCSVIVTVVSTDIWMQRSAWGISIILGLFNLYLIYPKLKERAKQTFNPGKKKKG